VALRPRLSAGLPYLRMNYAKKGSAKQGTAQRFGQISGIHVK
jgi:hypothetical protein